MNTTAIVDYGLCNLDSIARAVEECGGAPLVSTLSSDLDSASRIILPGVGSYARAMGNLRQSGLDQSLRKQVRDNQVPLLAICLGMQLLSTKGFEGGETDGLDLIQGEVRPLRPFGDDVRIPHVGWNEVEPVKNSKLFTGITGRRDFYFVHSYHFVCSNPADVLAITSYAGGFNSAVGRNNIMGVQFHPEKSQDAGFLLLRNFLSM